MNVPYLSRDVTPVPDRDPEPSYEPPRLDRLGSLAQLTQGGLAGPDDGFGGAGDEGSL